jgi:hypothetical protein
MRKIPYYTDTFKITQLFHLIEIKTGSALSPANVRSDLSFFVKMKTILKSS